MGLCSSTAFPSWLSRQATSANLLILVNWLVQPSDFTAPLTEGQEKQSVTEHSHLARTPTQTPGPLQGSVWSQPEQEYRKESGAATMPAPWKRARPWTSHISCFPFHCAKWAAFPSPFSESRDLKQEAAARRRRPLTD